MMHRLGIEAIRIFGLPPVEYVNLAADLAALDPELIGYVQLSDAPLLAQAKAGIGPHQRLRPVVAATRALLEQV